MESLYQETKNIMKKYNITANKNLGQNFLVDENTVQGIIEKAQINSSDLVIEIGPGLGTLTKPLLENAGKVICIELDERMINLLQERFSLYNNFEIIHNDVLKENLSELIQKEKNQGKIKQVKVVANLPYYITTPIIMKLIEDKLDIQSITVMVQKEVAQRLAAKPGEEYTGAITYAIWYYSEPKIILEVPKESFVPAPAVDSSVIQLHILKETAIEVIDEKILFKVIQAAFSQKRKTLVNALTNSNILPKKTEVEIMLQELGFDLKIRGEKLSLEDFGKIADYLVRKSASI